MSKNVVQQLNITDEDFKKIKKNKQSILLRLNDEENKKIKVKDKIILINSKNKKLKKKVKQIYSFSTFEEIGSKVKKKKLGYKKKDTISYDELAKDYDKATIKKYGVLGIELKTKKHIFRKILLIILVIVLVFLGVRYINNKLDEMNSKKVNAAINELQKDKTDYVFVEINPSFVLSIENNKVDGIACLNEDCLSFYNEIDVKGKSISESIDNLYNMAKNKGFDTSNGVKIKTTIELNIDNKDYVTIEYINESIKNELLSNVKNNEEIKNSNNDNYYTNLWEELKKDKDYGKIYSCNMNNEELECYFIMSALETGINSDNDYNTSNVSEYEKLMSIFNIHSNTVFNTFKKFNIEVKNNKAYINGIQFGSVPLFTLNNTPYKNVLSAKIIEPLPNEVCEEGFAEYQDGKCQVDDGVYVMPLEKLNLLNPSASLSNMIISRMGLKENILEKYEVMKMLGQ